MGKENRKRLEISNMAPQLGPQRIKKTRADVNEGVERGNSGDKEEGGDFQE